MSRIVIITFVFLIFVPKPCYAALIQYQFTGSVNRVTDTGGLLGGTISLGTPFTGMIAYDTSTPDGQSDPGVGAFTHPAPLGPVGFSFTVAGFTFHSDPARPMAAFVFDNSASFPAGSDLIQLNQTFVDPASTPDVGIPLNMQFTLVDENANAVPSDALPTALDLADWTFSEMIAFDTGGGSQFFVGGSLTSLSPALSVSVVPEPSTLALFSLGLIALIRRRRKRPA